MKKLSLYVFISLLFCKMGYSNSFLPSLTCDRFKPTEARYTFDFKNQIMIIDKISRKDINSVDSLDKLLGYFFLPDDITKVLRIPMLGDKDSGAYAYVIKRISNETAHFKNTYLLTFFSTNLDNIFEIKSKELEYRDVVSLIGRRFFFADKDEEFFTIPELNPKKRLGFYGDSKKRLGLYQERDDDEERKIIKKLQKERFKNFFDETAVHIKQKCHGVNW